MYSYIKGTLVSFDDGIVVIDNNGIGYTVNVSNNCLCRLGSVGEIVTVYTYLNVREDEMSLFGFYCKEEKAMFLKLITISGVGPRLALAVLSGIELVNLSNVIATGDIKTLSTIKGLGKKTSERIILELRGSIEDLQDAAVPSVIQSESISDAVNALISLGLSRQEAYSAVVKASSNTQDTGELVSIALRSLYK